MLWCIDIAYLGLCLAPLITLVLIEADPVLITAVFFHVIVAVRLVSSECLVVKALGYGLTIYPVLLLTPKSE